MARINPAGLAALQARLSVMALRGAEAAVEALKPKMEGGGSGKQHAGLPRRSSAPGEYPAEQTGELVKSLKARAGKRPGFAEFGSIDGPAYAVTLHMRPPDSGGRPFMDDALADKDVQKAALDAMRGH